MVNWILLFIVIGIVSQYIIYILDYPRRRYNMGYRIFTQYQRPEPMWFEIITTTNQILVCGGVVVLFFYFLITKLLVYA